MSSSNINGDRDFIESKGETESIERISGLQPYTSNKIQGSLANNNTAKKTNDCTLDLFQKQLSNDLLFLNALNEGKCSLTRETISQYKEIQEMLTSHSKKAHFTEKMQEIFNLVFLLNQKEEIKKNYEQIESQIKVENKDIAFLENLENLHPHLIEYEQFTTLVLKYQYTNNEPVKNKIHLKISTLLSNKEFTSSYFEWMNQKFDMSLSSETRSMQELILDLYPLSLKNLQTLTKIFEMQMVLKNYKLDMDEAFNDKSISIIEILDSIFNQEPFQEDAIRVLKDPYVRNRLTIIEIIQLLKKHPFPPDFIEKIDSILLENCTKCATTVVEIPEDSILSIDRQYIIDRAKTLIINPLYYEESNTAPDLNDRYYNILTVLKDNPNSSSTTAVISAGDLRFECKITDGRITIIDYQGAHKKDAPAPFNEPYIATFDTPKDAATFLSALKDPGIEKINTPICFALYLNESQRPFLDTMREDQAFIESFNIDSYSFEDLKKIGTILENCYSQGLYSPKVIDDIYKKVTLDFEKYYKSDPKNLETLFSNVLNQDPLKSLPLVAQLQSLPFTGAIGKTITDYISEIQKTLVAKFILKIDTAKNGINQFTFSDPSIKVYQGGSSYCCGSLAVAALKNAMYKTNKSIEELLKEGVVAHLTLSPEKMLDGISLGELNDPLIRFDFNKRVSEDPLKLLSSLPYKRFENILTNIPNSSSGILHVENRALMCSVREDGSVEIFDSHGSSSPMIVGGKTPAYNAIFSTKEAAAYYLSVHSKLVMIKDIGFIPANKFS